MKLQTSIPPRRTGVVNVTGDDGLTYVFQPDATGILVCDVSDPPTLKRLLTHPQGLFEPASEDDFEAAIAMSKEVAKANLDPEDDDTDDDFSEELAPGGLPIEADTPPVIRKKPGRKPKAE